jgi:hypothetical protein
MSDRTGKIKQLLFILFNKFFSHATREKLQKYVTEHFLPERVKTLTRDEIVTYGKGKSFIVEA